MDVNNESVEATSRALEFFGFENFHSFCLLKKSKRPSASNHLRRGSMQRGEMFLSVPIRAQSHFCMCTFGICRPGARGRTKKCYTPVNEFSEGWTVKFLSVLLAGVIFLAVSPARVCAQSSSDSAIEKERRTIEGNVYLGDTNQPAADITVALYNAEDLTMDDGHTGSNGEFAFRGLRPGSYTLTIDAQGFQKVSTVLDLTFTSSKGNILRLRKSGSEAQARGGGSAVSVHLLSMPTNAREAFDAGKQKLYHDKNPQGSLEEFQKAVTISPGFYEAFEQMGLAYLELGKSEDAEKAASRSIELSNDKYAAADFDLGAMLMNRRQFADGEKIVRHGLELDPSAWIGHYELGRALFYEKRVPDALKSAEQARSLQPNAAITYRLLALIHTSQHDESALLQDLDAYIRLDPDSAMGLRAKQLRDKVATSIPPDSSPRP